MRLHLLALLPAVLAAAVPAQQKQSQEELVRLRDEKLKKPVFHRVAWLFDYDEARQQAQKQGKPIFAYFTRSFRYCEPCEKIEAGALADVAFGDFAKKIVLFVHNTSKCDGDKYPSLLTDKGLSGFPSVCFLDAQGEVIVQGNSSSIAGFDSTVAGFESTLAKVGNYLQLKAKAASDPALQKQLLFAELDLERLDAAALRQRAAELKNLTAAEQLRIDQRLTDTDVRNLTARTRELGQEEIGKQIAALAKAGHRPSEASAATFWGFVLQHASRSKDGELADQAFAELDHRYGSDPKFARAVANWQQLLAQAKAR
ncbi:MAG TPA: thioredoxin family protein [Planctomycetota bacterium]|nr:thioredoxin family protein [Planctomycetota bacterium]